MTDLFIFSFFVINLFRAVTRFIKLLLFIRKLASKNYSAADLFETQVEKHPNKICLMMEDRQFTFKEVCQTTNIDMN